MARKAKKSADSTPVVKAKPKKKKPEVEDIRDTVQKGISTGAQVADFVFDIIKLFS